MLHNLMDRAFFPAAWLLERNDMQPLGMNTTMGIARTYNRLKFGRCQARREERYQREMTQLLRENGMPARPPVQMIDGWAIDDSMSYPLLQDVLRDGDEIIRERGGIPRENYGKPFLQDIFTAADAARYPSFINFITSTEVLQPVCEYLGFIPCLSRSTPPAVRLTESSIKFDDMSHLPPRSSQLHHLDYHDGPMVYVIVALRDITKNSGPFCFLPALESKKAAERLNYRARGIPYRIKDEDIYAVCDRSKLVEFTCKAGTVLFIDSARCFHYGSRNSVETRYQLMYSFVSACRSDFTEVLRPLRTYNWNDGDSRLKKLVIDKRCQV